MSKYYLGIDTSNYTTSVALCKDGEIIKNLKSPVKVKDGERGVRQSDAVFSHIQNLPALMDELGAVELTAVGVSARPRDVDGSYMPCFLSGVASAVSIARVCGVPLYEFAHQQGHVMAALYSCGKTDMYYKRFIAFHVSGGTTEVLLCENGTIDKVGGTLDLNAGQVIDRIGVMMDIPFPCGKYLEEISCDFSDTNCYSHVRGLECNLSGLENKAVALYNSGADRSLVAGYTLKSVCRTIDKLTQAAIDKYGNIPIVYAGGVMSNKQIREELSKKYAADFASPQYSCDNAAGIAILCKEKHENGK